MNEQTFRLYIRTESDAFITDRGAEVSRLLRSVADRIESGEDFSHYRTLFDLNGNDVGRAAFKPE